MAEETAGLEPFPEDWERGLAVVAHPDDMEYGAAAAVARWTAAGQVGRLRPRDRRRGRHLDRCRPAEAGPIRRDEQIAELRGGRASTDVEFLGLPDGDDRRGPRAARRPRRGHPPAPARRRRCRSTSATRGAGRAGTTPTTAPSAGRCSTRCATPPTRGCSRIAGDGVGRRPVRGVQRQPAADPRGRRHRHLRRSACGRSRATAPTSRTSAATWPRRTSSSAAPRPSGRGRLRRRAGGHVRDHRLRSPCSPWAYGLAAGSPAWTRTRPAVPSTVTIDPSGIRSQARVRFATHGSPYSRGSSPRGRRRHRSRRPRRR